MTRPQEERKEHLDLEEECIEIGGDSRMFRAVLAHHLGTTMEGLGMKTGLCCHACHNAKCSNPKHLYWGTASENVLDAYAVGSMKAPTNTKEQLRKNGALGGAKGGGHNKLSEEVIKKRVEDYYNEKRIWGRNERLAKKWGVSHSQVSRFLKKYISS